MWPIHASLVLSPLPCCSVNARPFIERQNHASKAKESIRGQRILRISETQAP